MRGVINTIAGGFVGGGTTYSSRKRHLRAISFVYSIHRWPRRSMLPILFTDDDFKIIDTRHNDPMVVTIEVANFLILKTLIDQGSSMDILYWKTFKKMGLPLDTVVYFNEQIVGLSGERVDTQRYIDLDTKFGEGNECCKTIRVRYLLVDAKSSYNILLGRPSLNKLGAIVSTPHLTMKFPSDCKSRSKNVVTLHSYQKTIRECYAASLRILPRRQAEGRKSTKLRPYMISIPDPMTNHM